MIPYLTRTLGQEGFGKVIFSQSFVMLANILPEYGFSLSATRDIAANRSNYDKLCLIVSNTIYSKFFLLTISCLIISPLGFIIPIFRDNLDLFLISFLLLFSMSINSDWFFYGMENLKYYTLATVLGKTTLVIMTFFLINNHSKPYVYLLIFSITTLITNVINLILLGKQVDFIKVKFNYILKNIREALNLFIFKLSVSLYTSSNSFLVGLILGPKEVGIFSGAEKIIKAFVGIWGPLNNTLYPRLNNLLSTDIKKAKKIIKSALFLYALLSLGLVIFLLFLGDNIAVLFLGKDFLNSSEILKFLSPIIFLIAISNVLGILWLLPLKKDKQFNFVIISAGLINLALGIPLTISFGILGMAISIVITELYVTLGSIYLVSKIKEFRIV